MKRNGWSAGKKSSGTDVDGPASKTRVASASPSLGSRRRASSWDDSDSDGSESASSFPRATTANARIYSAESRLTREAAESSLNEEFFGIENHEKFKILLKTEKSNLEEESDRRQSPARIRRRKKSPNFLSPTLEPLDSNDSPKRERHFWASNLSSRHSSNAILNLEPKVFLNNFFGDACTEHSAVSSDESDSEIADLGKDNSNSIIELELEEAEVRGEGVETEGLGLSFDDETFCNDGDLTFCSRTSRKLSQILEIDEVKKDSAEGFSGEESDDSNGLTIRKSPEKYPETDESVSGTRLGTLRTLGLTLGKSKSFYDSSQNESDLEFEKAIAKNWNGSLSERAKCNSGKTDNEDLMVFDSPSFRAVKADVEIFSEIILSTERESAKKFLVEEIPAAGVCIDEFFEKGSEERLDQSSEVKSLERKIDPKKKSQLFGGYNTAEDGQRENIYSNLPRPKYGIDPEEISVMENSEGKPEVENDGDSQSEINLPSGRIQTQNGSLTSNGSTSPEMLKIFPGGDGTKNYENLENIPRAKEKCLNSGFSRELKFEFDEVEEGKIDFRLDSNRSSETLKNLQSSAFESESEEKSDLGGATTENQRDVSLLFEDLPEKHSRKRSPSNSDEYEPRKSLNSTDENNVKPDPGNSYPTFTSGLNSFKARTTSETEKTDTSSHIINNIAVCSEKKRSDQFKESTKPESKEENNVESTDMRSEKVEEDGKDNSNVGNFVKLENDGDIVHSVSRMSSKDSSTRDEPGMICMASSRYLRTCDHEKTNENLSNDKAHEKTTDKSFSGKVDNLNLQESRDSSRSEDRKQTFTTEGRRPKSEGTNVNGRETLSPNGVNNESENEADKTRPKWNENMKTYSSREEETEKRLKKKDKNKFLEEELWKNLIDAFKESAVTGNVCPGFRESATNSFVQNSDEFVSSGSEASVQEEPSGFRSFNPQTKIKSEEGEKIRENETGKEIQVKFSGEEIKGINNSRFWSPGLDSVASRKRKDHWVGEFGDVTCYTVGKCEISEEIRPKDHGDGDILQIQSLAKLPASDEEDKRKTGTKANFGEINSNKSVGKVQNERPNVRKSTSHRGLKKSKSQNSVLQLKALCEKDDDDHSRNKSYVFEGLNSHRIKAYIGPENGNLESNFDSDESLESSTTANEDFVESRRKQKKNISHKGESRFRQNDENGMIPEPKSTTKGCNESNDEKICGRNERKNPVKTEPKCWLTVSKKRSGKTRSIHKNKFQILGENEKTKVARNFFRDLETGLVSNRSSYATLLKLRKTGCFKSFYKRFISIFCLASMPSAATSNR